MVFFAARRGCSSQLQKQLSCSDDAMQKAGAILHDAKQQIGAQREANQRLKEENSRLRIQLNDADEVQSILVSHLPARTWSKVAAHVPPKLSRETRGVGSDPELVPLAVQSRSSRSCWNRIRLRSNPTNDGLPASETGPCKSPNWTNSGRRFRRPLPPPSLLLIAQLTSACIAASAVESVAVACGVMSCLGQALVSDNGCANCNTFPHISQVWRHGNVANKHMTRTARCSLANKHREMTCESIARAQPSYLYQRADKRQGTPERNQRPVGGGGECMMACAARALHDANQHVAAAE